MSKKLYKFNIEQKLNELSFEERNKALKLIPEQLGISKDSFYAWRRIKKDSAQDIPSVKLTALANFFKCPVTEMINYEVPVITMNVAVHSRSYLRNKFKMSES
jgi:hypothetical protein